MTGIAALRTKAKAHLELPAPRARRMIREAAGLSQEDVASAFDPPVHRETISRWEAGERTPRGSRLIQYVEILRQLREIAGGTEPKPAA